MRWQRIEALPPAGERPRCALVVVSGRVRASNRKFFFQLLGTGLAHTTKSGDFDVRDIAAIENRNEMDSGSGKVTHWIPLKVPEIPQAVDRVRRFAPPGYELIKHDEEQFAVLSEEQWGKYWLIGVKVPVSKYGASMHKELDCDAESLVWCDVLSTRLICLVGKETMAVKLPELQ